MAGTLVKTVTLQITGVIKDAAEKIGLITRDVQKLADKSPVELKAELTGSEEVKLRLKEIEARAEKLKEEFPEFAAKIDIGAASAKLAVLRAEIRKTADTGRSLSDRISGIGKALAKATPAWTGFVAAGLALGPALLPVLAAVTGATIGLGAAVIGAGSAVGIFALAAKGNLSELQKALTKVQAANKAAALAEATTASKRTAAQKQAIVTAHDLTAAFQKEFGAEANAIEKLKSSWKTFETQPVVTNAIAQGAKLLTDALPKLTPLLRLGALAMNIFTSSLSGWVNSGGLAKFVHGLVAVGRPAIIGFVTVLHNLAIAFGALSGGAANFAGGVINGLVKLSAAFATWATNKGPGALSGLMDTIRKLGPGVLDLIKALAAAVPNLAKGLFPLAPLSLALSTALAGIIAHVDPHVITALALAFVSLWGAVKLIVAVTKVWEAVQLVMNAILAANPIGLIVLALAGLVAGFILAYKHSATFRKIVQESFHVVLDVIRGVWDWIKGHWPLLLTILTGPVGLAVVFIVKHWNAIRDGISAVLGWIGGHWRLLLGILTGPVGAAVTFILGHWSQITGGARAVLSFFRSAWQGIAHLLEAPFQVALGVIKGIWKTILGIWHRITGFGGGAPVPGGRGHGMGGGSGGANAQMARQMYPSWGSGAEWSSWNALTMGESGWSSTIANTSGALGIAQALGHGVSGGGGSLGNQYGGYGLSLAGDRAANSGVPQPQITWQHNYIASSYGDPINAYAQWLGRSPHWYDGPGPQYLPTGLSMALNTTGGPERVLSPGEQRGIERRLDQVITELRKLPAVQAAQLGRVLSGRPVAPRPSVFAAR